MLHVKQTLGDERAFDFVVPGQSVVLDVAAKGTGRLGVVDLGAAALTGADSYVDAVTRQHIGFTQRKYWVYVCLGGPVGYEFGVLPRGVLPTMVHGAHASRP